MLYIIQKSVRFLLQTKHSIFFEGPEQRNMIKIILLLIVLFLQSFANGQTQDTPYKTEVMTLGVFHFEYPNLDAVRIEEKDKISVLDEPYQSEIAAIIKAIKEFNPTVIAIEFLPQRQQMIDSLYSLYESYSWELGKNEVYQLGFRLGRKLNISKIYCVDDPGKHYDNITEIFGDSLRLAKFEHYYFNSPDSAYELPRPKGKVKSIIDALLIGNDPVQIKERLATYLLHPFKYEEHPGDFTGVDFESGRWYNRNLRIFRNIQRIPRTVGDKILFIVGSEHLNLLNLFFDVSREFELISPLKYLNKARELLHSNFGKEDL